MSQPTLKTTLSALESQLGILSSALADGSTDQLLVYAAELQGLVLEVNALLSPWQSHGALGQQDVTRIRTLGLGLLRVREHLARRQALVEQTLQVMVPATQVPVYTAVPGLFGTVRKTSGRLNVLSA